MSTTASASASMHDAWEDGWHAHYLEWARQRKDPAHPITKTNPHASTKESNMVTNARIEGAAQALAAAMGADWMHSDGVSKSVYRRAAVAALDAADEHDSRDCDQVGDDSPAGRVEYRVVVNANLGDIDLDDLASMMQGKAVR